MPNVEYTEITETDKLNILRDALRGRESDHWRLSHLGEAEGVTPERLDELAEQIVSLRKDVAAQEKLAKKEQKE